LAMCMYRTRGELLICVWNHHISWHPLCTCVMYPIFAVATWLLAQELARRVSRLRCWFLREHI
jgi:hypothetical protein